MKKLILVSMLYQVTDLVRTIAPELEGKTVTYIPTAGIAEEVEGMVEEETSTLESLGMTVDVLEVSTASQEEIVDSLKRNDVIFVGGGNTFFLLQELRRSEADQILIQEVEKGQIVHRRVSRFYYSLSGYRVLRRDGQSGESSGADRLCRFELGGFLYRAPYRKRRDGRIGGESS